VGAVPEVVGVVGILSGPVIWSLRSTGGGVPTQERWWLVTGILTAVTVVAAGVVALFVRFVISLKWGTPATPAECPTLSICFPDTPMWGNVVAWGAFFTVLATAAFLARRR
jgi:hypothetical protein